MNLQDTFEGAASVSKESLAVPKLKERFLGGGGNSSSLSEVVNVSNEIDTSTSSSAWLVGE